MTERITAEEFNRRLATNEIVVGRKGRLLEGVKPASKVSAPSEGDRPQEGPRKSKLGNTKTKDEFGVDKDSRLEAKHASEYRMMLKAGVIAMYSPQAEILVVSPRTGGKHTYKCDHQLTHWDGTVELIDSKGFETKEYRKKANWMETQVLPKCPWMSFKARYADGSFKIYKAKPGKKKKGAG